MNNKFHLLYIFIIVVLVALLLASKRQIKVVENRVTDTIYSVRIDTLLIRQLEPKYIHVVDTFYISSDNGTNVQLPIEQRYYSDNGVFDLWISGYNPTLDSIKTYPRIEYRTITNNVTKEIYKSTLDFYPYIGFRRFDNKVGQVIGLSVKMPKKWMYSGEIGVMDNKMMYGITVSYKMN